MYEKRGYQSKTVVALVIEFILAIFLIIQGKPVNQEDITMDNLSKVLSEQTKDGSNDYIGIGMLGAGTLALKGRYDVDKRMRKKDEKNKE